VVRPLLLRPFPTTRRGAWRCALASAFPLRSLRLRGETPFGRFRRRRPSAFICACPPPAGSSADDGPFFFRAQPTPRLLTKCSCLPVPSLAHDVARPSLTRRRPYQDTACSRSSWRVFSAPPGPSSKLLANHPRPESDGPPPGSSYLDNPDSPTGIPHKPAHGPPPGMYELTPRHTPKGRCKSVVVERTPPRIAPQPTPAVPGAATLKAIRAKPSRT
jgi:hypothetical protein